MNFTTNQDIAFVHANKMDMSGDSQLNALMADLEKQHSFMKRRQSVQDLLQPLPFSNLHFSNDQINTQMTLEDLLGDIDQKIFDQPQAMEQADALISAFDATPLHPLPIEPSTSIQEIPEALQSIDDIIGILGQSNGNKNSNSDIDSLLLEPLPLFSEQEQVIKRGLELTETEEQGPVAKKQKRGKVEHGDSTQFFRSYQAEQWTERFHELCDFVQEHGHCQVPHTFTENPVLARWVKRQRYQYKLRLEKKASTMTEDRIIVLEKIGFVWDSHIAAWEERINELVEFKKNHGHCNVPSNHESRQLAIWVKRQRRQYKFFLAGKASSMTNERIEALEKIGFEWELRCREPKN